MNDKIFSVWNKSSKKMSELSLKDTHVLNKENFTIRKPHTTDIEGNTIYEKDWILILNENSFSEVSIIENGLAKNLRTGVIVQDIEKWKNCIVVGNSFEGIQITMNTLNKYNLVVKQKERFAKTEQVDVKNMSYEEKIEANICPDCSSKLVANSGCKQCNDCGFSACSL